MSDMMGYFDLDDDEERGVICVCDNISFDSFLDTCCEEWAHARTAHLCDDEEPHTSPFWAEYGRIVLASREHHW